MLRTNLCEQLGIEYPVFSAGFAAGAGPELVAAVSNAGGCGVLGGSSYRGPSLREHIRRLRQLTNQPFGVNLILDGIEEDQIDTCLAERVPILVFFWGDARPYVADAHQNGVKVFIQVGSVDEARAAADAGVDAIIAQGRGKTRISAKIAHSGLLFMKTASDHASKRVEKQFEHILHMPLLHHTRLHHSLLKGLEKRFRSAMIDFCRDPSLTSTRALDQEISYSQGGTAGWRMWISCQVWILE